MQNDGAETPSQKSVATGLPHWECAEGKHAGSRIRRAAANVLSLGVCDQRWRARAARCRKDLGASSRARREGKAMPCHGSPRAEPFDATSNRARERWGNLSERIPVVINDPAWRPAAREFEPSSQGSPNATSLKPLQDPLQSLGDAELLARIAQRDRAAFTQLYDRYAGVLFATAIRILKDPKEAEDALQEVFVQLWNKAETYDAQHGKPFNWAVTLTRHKCIDRLRMLKRRYTFMEAVTEEMASQTAEPNGWNHEVFGQEKAALIRSAVQALPLEQRQAIEMAFLGGMTQNDISAALEQPLGTVKARIRRGMLKLRESLRDLL